LVVLRISELFGFDTVGAETLLDNPKIQLFMYDPCLLSASDTVNQYNAFRKKYTAKKYEHLVNQTKKENKIIPRQHYNCVVTGDH